MRYDARKQKREKAKARKREREIYIYTERERMSDSGRVGEEGKGSKRLISQRDS